MVYAYREQRPFDRNRRFYDCFEKVTGGNAEWRACALGWAAREQNLMNLRSALLMKFSCLIFTRTK